MSMDLTLQMLTDTVTSPWVYLLILVCAGLDSLLPVVPSETVLITAAAYASTGQPHPLGLLTAAVVGAVAGDFAAHLVGRSGGGVVQRWRRHPRLGRVLSRSEEIFSRRGGAALIAGRFVPGGRTAATIASGVLAFPMGRFLIFDSLGALAWASYSTSIGLLGGLVFEDRPLLGVALGVGIALVVTAIAEVVRRIAEHRSFLRGTGRTHREPTRSTTVQADMAR